MQHKLRGHSSIFGTPSSCLHKDVQLKRLHSTHSIAKTCLIWYFRCDCNLLQTFNLLTVLG